MTQLRHWDALLSRTVESSLDLTDGLTFGVDDTFLISQEAAASGETPATAEIKGQDAPGGQATPGGDLRLAGGDPGAVGQFAGDVIVELGPAVTDTTAGLSLQSEGAEVLRFARYIGQAAALAAEGLVLRLYSSESVRLVAGDTGVSAILSSAGSFALAFVQRFTQDMGQRQVLPAGGTGVSGTIDLDFNVCERWHYSLSGNVTFSAPDNVLPGTRYTIKLTQDGAGNRTASWNSVFKFGALNGTLSVVGDAIDIFVFEGSESGDLHCIIAAKGVQA